MKETFVLLPSEFINLPFYKLLSLLLEAGPQNCKKKKKQKTNQNQKTVRIWLFTLLSNARKTTGTETQVSNHFKLSDLPAEAETHNFRKLCGCRAHLVPVKEDGQCEPRNKPSKLGSRVRSLFLPCSSAPALGYSPAGQGSTLERQIWGVRNVSTAHHYFC